MNLTVVDQRGGEHRLTAAEGNSLMEAIRDAGLSIAAQCGGCCACATCHVYVGAAWLNSLPARSAEEEEMLELAQDVSERSRLACQIETTNRLDGLQVELAPGTEP